MSKKQWLIVALSEKRDTVYVGEWVATADTASSAVVQYRNRADTAGSNVPAFSGMTVGAIAISDSGMAQLKRDIVAFLNNGGVPLIDRTNLYEGFLRELRQRRTPEIKSFLETEEIRRRERTGEMPPLAESKWGRK